MIGKMVDKKFHLGSNYIIKLLQGKWKVSIVCALGIKPMYYGELLKYERNINHTQIAKKVLTEELNQLFDEQIVSKKIYNTVPPKVKYFLTPEGQDLSATLLKLNKIGERIAGKVGGIAFDIDSHQADIEHSKLIEELHNNGKEGW